VIRFLAVLVTDFAYYLKPVNVSMVGKDQLALSLPALEFWIATEEDSASDPTSVTAKKTGLVPTVRKLLAMNEGTAATEESALPPTSKSELINQVKRELTPFSDRAVYAIIYIYNFFFIKKEYCL